MTPVQWIEALTAEVALSARNFVLEREYQSDREVHVYAQYIDRAKFEQDNYYPLITVEFLGVDDTAADSVASFIITVGVYAGEDEGSGWKDLLNLAEAVRQHLLTHALIGGCLSLELPLALEVNQEQPIPFLFASIGVSYKVYSVRPGIY